jgi:2-(1,2-epoxy-1,2-dihydrophenyl)acetyl-CoA isomerase
MLRAIIASGTARFMLVFCHVGVVPDGGAMFFLTQNLGLLRAKERVFFDERKPKFRGR